MYRGHFQAEYVTPESRLGKIELKLNINMNLPIYVYLDERDLAKLDALREKDTD